MSSGGGGGNTTTTQKADPWSGVQPYLRDAYTNLEALYAQGQGPNYYPGQTVAPMDTWTQTGLMQLGNATPGMAQAANQAASGVSTMGNQGAIGATTGLNTAGNASNMLMQAGNPQNNPYFQSALQSAIRPVTQQFQEQVMPGIKSGAQDAGQFGGSRQGVAEGIASRGYMDTVGDISANMGNAAYAQGLQAMANAGQLGSNIYGQGMTGLGQAAALAPTVQQALGMPGQTLLGIGQQTQAQNQAQIDAEINRWNYSQNRPYTMMSDYLAMLNGAQGGTTTAQQSGGGGNRMTGALGGAATGAAMGSMFGPMGTGIGAGAGALYGLFM